MLVLHVLRYHGDAERQQMATYTHHASQMAVPHGARVAGWFEAEGTIIGDGRRWDQARFNAFPSRAAVRAVALDPDRLAAQRDHREARSPTPTR